MEMLVEYTWPGNVRELQNVVERAVILSRNSVITPAVIAIAPAVEARPPVAVAELPPPSTSAKPAIVPFTEAERRAIIRALELTGWRISGRNGAADVLGLKPTTLHAKMKKLGIHRPSAAAEDSQPQAS
jgi:transcriptional regulator with GAF, ATPase, and Fis domain